MSKYLEECDVVSLRHMINELDRNLIAGQIPSLIFMKSLVKEIDGIDLEEISKDLYEYDELKDSMSNIYFRVDEFADGITLLENAVKQITELKESFETMGLKLDAEKANAYNQLVESLETLSKVYNSVEANASNPPIN